MAQGGGGDRVEVGCFKPLQAHLSLSLEAIRPKVGDGSAGDGKR